MSKVYPNNIITFPQKHVMVWKLKDIVKSSAFGQSQDHIQLAYNILDKHEVEQTISQKTALNSLKTKLKDATSPLMTQEVADIVTLADVL